jgi:anthranilate synthase
MTQRDTLQYRTRGGVGITRREEALEGREALEALAMRLDERRGVLLTSCYEYPGRYTRFDFGFTDPPLAIVGKDRRCRIEALNARGRVLLAGLAPMLAGLEAVEAVEPGEAVESGEAAESGEDALEFSIATSDTWFPEEQRSKQPSLFSVVRAVVEHFASPDDAQLGLYGAFGYDLALQFEPLRKRLERPPDQRDLVLYLPDELWVVDHQRGVSAHFYYEFEVDGRSTEGLARDGERLPYEPGSLDGPDCDHRPGEYADLVREAREVFRRGDLFEVVPGQMFSRPCPAPPSTLFQRICRTNPAPYAFLMNLGESEFLVGGSPEMYVRVEGRRVETCPISGTIARGRDAIEDAAQIRELLNSEKDESELTMCTDVDRNDKSRICEPDSVRVIGRRQIELYSRLIHTVDHVEGTLLEGFDALDAFLAHTWAVTVTGAPKAWAMQFIEDHEKSTRRWYGGAIGAVGFDGRLNTGLTLRTIRVSNGVAEVRAGATLLFDSDPDAEERETHIKASAFLDAVTGDAPPAAPRAPSGRPGAGRRILLVDHQDSFVHTLGNYLRQTGAQVATWRSGFDPAELDAFSPDAVVLSPGPGTPRDFDVAGTLRTLDERNLPVFGVCLGLQGIVEFLGGSLDVLPTPMHGKPSRINVLGGRLFEGLPSEFRAGRYHSLYARKESLPEDLAVTAESQDGVVMAVEHRERPLIAVQFHPESILTFDQGVGLRLIHNAVALLCPQ